MAETASGNFQDVEYSKVGGRATIMLNRPERRNATTTLTYEEILSAARDADRDPNVRVVVLKAAGTVFCAGQDNSATAKADAAGYLRYAETNHATQAFLRGMSKPVVASINGAAAGGGCIMALLTPDITIASTNARFAIREIAAGLSGPLTFLYSAGRARAMFMAMTGAWITADQAMDWGLLYQAVPPEQLDAEVDTVVQMLQDLPPLGLAATKEKMNFAMTLLNLPALAEFSRRQDQFLHTTADRKEAQAAFLEKRKPVFHGR